MKPPIRRVIPILAILIVPATVRAQERVSISILPAPPVVAGKTVDLVMVLDIKEGFHIQAVNAKKPYVPTTLKVEAPEDFEAGDPVFPDSKTVTLFGEQLSVYAGKVKVKIPVTVPKNARGRQTISVTVNYQACDDNTCDEPKDATTETDVTIQPPRTPVKKPPVKKLPKKKGK